MRQDGPLQVLQGGGVISGCGRGARQLIFGGTCGARSAVVPVLQQAQFESGNRGGLQGETVDRRLRYEGAGIRHAAGGQHVLPGFRNDRLSRAHTLGKLDHYVNLSAGDGLQSGFFASRPDSFSIPAVILFRQAWIWSRQPERGGKRALLQLFDEHHLPLFRFAYRLTGSVADAEDIVQECFLDATAAGMLV